MSNKPIKPAATHGPLLPCLSRAETSHLLGHQWQHLRDCNGHIPDYLGCINTLQIVPQTTYGPVQVILQSYHIKPYQTISFHIICKSSTYTNKLSKHQIRSSLTNKLGTFQTSTLWVLFGDTSIFQTLDPFWRILLDSSCTYSTLQKKMCEL